MIKVLICATVKFFGAVAAFAVAMWLLCMSVWWLREMATPEVKAWVGGAFLVGAGIWLCSILIGLFMACYESCKGDDE
jgi:hypothetical protein